MNLLIKIIYLVTKLANWTQYKKISNLFYNSVKNYLLIFQNICTLDEGF